MKTTSPCKHSEDSCNMQWNREGSFWCFCWTRSMFSLNHSLSPMQRPVPYHGSRLKPALKYISGPWKHFEKSPPKSFNHCHFFLWRLGPFWNSFGETVDDRNSEGEISQIRSSFKSENQGVAIYDWILDSGVERVSSGVCDNLCYLCDKNIQKSQMRYCYRSVRLCWTPETAKRKTLQTET